MITKKLFTPKCQHVDRDLVFRDDLDNFFMDFLNWISDPNYNPKLLYAEPHKEKDISNSPKEKDEHCLNGSSNPRNDELKNRIDDSANSINVKNNTEDFIHNLEEFIEYKNPKIGIKENNNDIFSLDGESANDEFHLGDKSNPDSFDKNKGYSKNKFENTMENQNFLKDEIYNEKNTLKTLDYKVFKLFWNEKRMSMLHFCKSKEENYKEYYEVLFGEVQSFLIEANLRRKNEYKDKDILIVQILAIYTLYSLFFTQTTDFFYQINTIPEYLIKINQIIKTLLRSKFTTIAKELLLMVFRLHKADAFSIGVIPGLKTIILNKYGLPCEQRTNTYNDYMDINNNYKNLYLKDDDSYLNGLIHQYKNMKFDSLINIKNVIHQKDFDKEMYCEYVNNKNKLVECSKNDLAFLRIDNTELDKNINNLDLQFNIFDNFI